MNKYRAGNLRNTLQVPGGYSLVELITVVLIIGILSSISVSSFLAWRRNQIVKTYFEGLKLHLSALPNEAKKWGATCTLRILRNLSNSAPFTFNCISNGSQKSLSKCASATNCNISNLSTIFDFLPDNPQGNKLVYVLSNKENHQFTPRGQFSGGADSVFVISGTRVLGGSTVSRCIVIKNITAEIRTGFYSRATSQPATGATTVSTSLNPSYCRIV